MTMDGCVFCGESETSGHTLWSCKATAEMWKELGIKLPNMISTHRDFIDVVWLMREFSTNFDQKLFATLA